MKRYPIHEDELETWDLVLDRQGNWIVERSGRRGALHLSLAAFQKTIDGKRLGGKLAKAVVRAFEAPDRR